MIWHFVKRAKLNKVWFTAGTKFPYTMYSMLRVLILFQNHIIMFVYEYMHNVYICFDFFCVPKKFEQCVFFSLSDSFGLWIFSLLYHYQTFANPILWHKFEFSDCMCVYVCNHCHHPTAHVVFIQCKNDVRFRVDSKKLSSYDIIQNHTGSSCMYICATIHTTLNIIVCVCVCKARQN